MTQPVTGKALQDWRLMRTRWLRQLDKAVRSYQRYISEQGEEELTIEEAQARWKQEAELMARIHEAVHQLRDALGTDIFLTSELAGSPLTEVPKLALEKPADIFADLHTMHHDPQLTKTWRTHEERSANALFVFDAVIAYVESQLKQVRARAEDRSGGHDDEDEARAIWELLALASLYHDQSIVDPQTQDFAQEIWKMLMERDDRLCHELKEMTPPLTWGETLYHFLRDLEANRADPEADRRQKDVWRYLSPAREFYCLECDRPFPIDSRHPGRFICRGCKSNERKRNQRERQRKEGITPGSAPDSGPP